MSEDEKRLIELSGRVVRYDPDFGYMVQISADDFNFLLDAAWNRRYPCKPVGTPDESAGVAEAVSVPREVLDDVGNALNCIDDASLLECSLEGYADLATRRLKYGRLARAKLRPYLEPNPTDEGAHQHTWEVRMGEHGLQGRCACGARKGII